MKKLLSLLLALAMVLSVCVFAVAEEVPVITIAAPERINIEDWNSNQTTLMLEEALGEEVALGKGVMEPLADGEKALSPGLKHKHYAPKAEVKVVLGPDDLRAQYILDSAAKDARPCVLCLEGRRGLYPGLIVLSAGNTPEDYAHNLFAALRHADEIGCTQVYAEGLSLEGVGLAVMNRVERAAGFHVIQL